jgi:hypothetical protein
MMPRRSRGIGLYALSGSSGQRTSGMLPPLMAIYVVSIRGRSIVAFHATSAAAADQRVRELDFRDDLMSLSTDSVPLWDGVTAIEVRQALPPEELKWRASRARALRHGNIESADETWIAFLVPLTDPDRRYR